ncbi:MAG: hypothetical protein GXO43_05965 [Crenarchaeota archaeon]|nr:hypothetical protein [Thermoproteota archaeon]
MACETIDPEYIIPYIDMEEIIEALAKAAEDFIPAKTKHRTLLHYLNKGAQ